MIFDKAQRLSDYYSDLPLLKKVGDFIDEFNKNELDDGRYEIDGERVFAMVQSYRTKPQDEDSRFEAHKKYIDLQYIVSGTEKIRFAPLESVTLEEELYSKGSDIAFYTGEATRDFVLQGGMFLLLNPSDAHMPGLSAEADSDVRKIVFKILV